VNVLIHFAGRIYTAVNHRAHLLLFAPPDIYSTFVFVLNSPFFLHLAGQI